MRVNDKSKIVVCLIVMFTSSCFLLVACNGDRVEPSPFHSPTQSTRARAFDSPLSPVATPKGTVVPTADPTLGLSSDQPAPLGTTVIAEDGLQISILEVHRDAAEELINMNPFNTPRSSEEVVILRVRVTLTEPPSSPFILLPLDFDIVDDEGTVYPYPLTVIVKDELGGEFTRAATREGLLAFRIPRDHSELFLRYLPKDRQESHEPRWFALQ